MERAHQLIKPYLEKPGVIGIYLVGSATRPHADELSDLDIEVIVEDDAYANTPMNERQVFAFKDEESRVVDYEFYLIPWSDFVALKDSAHDLFHYPYQHAVVLHDPDQRIGPVIEELAAGMEAVGLEGIVMPHHIVGPLNGLQRLQFFGWHLKRHRAQLERTLGALS